MSCGCNPCNAPPPCPECCPEVIGYTFENANSLGIGVFESLVDTLVSFRGINSSDGSITVTYDSVNKTIDLAGITAGQLVKVVSTTLNAGVDSGFIDISSLGLSDPPTQVAFLSLNKNDLSDDNIQGTVVMTGVTSAQVPFSLTAETDNADRVAVILVVP